jgi:hypothetical protein
VTSRDAEVDGTVRDGIFAWRMLAHPRRRELELRHVVVRAGRSLDCWRAAPGRSRLGLSLLDSPARGATARCATARPALGSPARLARSARRLGSRLLAARLLASRPLGVVRRWSP